MGQAKLRGSYEQRKAEGKAKREKEMEERAAELAALDSTLTHDEKARRKNANALLTTLIGLASAGRLHY